MAVRTSDRDRISGEKVRRAMMTRALQPLRFD